MTDQQPQTVKRVLTGPLKGKSGRYGGIMFENGEAEIPADAKELDLSLRRYYGAKAPDESDEQAAAKVGPVGDEARIADEQARAGISYYDSSYDAGAQAAHDAGTPQASGRAPKGDAQPGSVEAQQAARDAAETAQPAPRKAKAAEKGSAEKGSAK